MRTRASFLGLVSFALFLVSCGGDDTGAAPDASGDHATAVDAGDSSTPPDAQGQRDGGLDAVAPDAGEDAGEDAGAVDAGVDAAGDASGPCNVVVNAAPVVTIAGVAGGLPNGTGGAILPGTYYLTGINQYSPDGGAGTVGHTVRQTQVWTAAGNGFDYQSVTSYDATPDVRTTGGVDVSSPPTINIQEVCPGGAATAGTYTFDAAANVLHVYDQVTSTELVLSLQ